MKLIFCPHCCDVRKLLNRYTECSCGHSYGWYKDDLHAIIGGVAIPIGINNTSFLSAIKSQPQEGMGERFEAFVIPKKCPTIETCVDYTLHKPETE